MLVLIVALTTSVSTSGLYCTEAIPAEILNESMVFRTLWDRKLSRDDIALSELKVRAANERHPLRRAYVNFRLAVIGAARNDRQAAIAASTSALQSFSEHCQSTSPVLLRLQLLMYDLLEGRDDGAAQAFLDAAGRHELGKLEVAYRIARRAQSDGRCQETDQLVDDAVFGATDYLSVRFQLLKVRCALDQGRLKAADEYLNKIPSSYRTDLGPGLWRAKLARLEGRFDAALAMLTDLDRRFSDQPAVLRELGFLYQSVGDYLNAKTAFSRQLSLLEERGATGARIAGVQHNLALAYSELGLWDASQVLFESAIDSFESAARYDGAARSKNEYALSLVNKPEVDSQELRLARRLVGQADRQLDDERFQGFLASTLGFVNVRSGRLSTAQSHFARALALIEQHESAESFHLSPALEELAKISLSQGNVRKADELVTRALEIRRRYGARSPRGLAQVLALAARVAYAKQDKGNAAGLSAAAIDVMRERLVAALYSGESVAVGEHWRWRSVFETALDVELGSQSCKTPNKMGLEAFQLAQLQGAGRAGLRRWIAADANHPDAFARLQAVQRGIVLLNQVVDDGYRKGVPQSVGSAIAEAEREREALLKQLRPSTLVQLPSARLLRESINADEMLLGFFEGVDSVFRLVVSQSGLELCRVALSAGDIGQLAVQIALSLRLEGNDAKPTRAFDTRSAKQLGNVLLSKLDLTTDEVIFSTTGLLQTIPASVIIHNDQFLGLERAVSYLPAISNIRLRRVAQRPRNVSYIGFYSSDLRLKQAAEGVSTLFDQGEALNISRLRTGISAKLALFATHGLMRGRSFPGIQNIPLEPSLSWQVSRNARINDEVRFVFEDDMLGASEIYRIGFSADIVVLNACSSAAGDGNPGDYSFTGLASAFLETGSRSVLASFWDVSVESSLELTRHFAEKLHAGDSAGKALLDAQQNVAKQYAHPAHWAAFGLIGDSNVNLFRENGNE